MSIGIFGIGLAAYWPQFEGLKERVEGYQRRVEERVAELGGEVVSAGLVDSEQAGREAGDRFAAAQVDLVICHAVTYATSSTVLPVAQAAKVPVLLLGLQPTTSLDYANTGTGEWLANCAACCVPELAGAFTRARHPLRHRRRHDRRRRAGVGEDRRLGARGGRRARTPALAHRLPRARVSGDARHVHRLHDGPRAGRRACRGAGDRRPRRAGGEGERRRGRGEGGRDPRDVRVRRPLRRPDRRADRAGGARLVGARRGRARRARRRLRARRADLLLPRRRRQRGRAARRRPDRRQLAADRARRCRPRARPTSRPTSRS